MAKNKRWMTWVLDESAKTEVALPWTRSARSDWKHRVSVKAPELNRSLKSA